MQCSATPYADRSASPAFSPLAASSLPTRSSNPRRRPPDPLPRPRRHDDRIHGEHGSLAAAMKIPPVARNGTGWSDVHQIGDIYTASFTSVGGENCKAFLKLGPPWQQGWVWVVRGWLCGIHGNSVDRDLQSFVDALIVKAQ
jgi:hypothetical protein